MLGELQKNLPWGAHEYTEEFNADTHPLRDMRHAYEHIDNAKAKIFKAVQDSHAHAGTVDRSEAARGLADLIICTVRMANTMLGGPIDLEQAILDRIAQKFPPKQA